MKKTLIVVASLVGLFVAIVLAGLRIYMHRHESAYVNVLYSDWFTVLTVVLWPSALYLAILSTKDPIKVVVTVYGLAILFNPLIYGFVGWLMWRIAKLANPRLE